METNVGRIHCCSCDPLKRIIQQLLREGIKDNEGSFSVENLASKLHLFYKSSGLRYPVTRGGRGKLECKVAEDTLKSLREWLVLLKEEDRISQNFCSGGGGDLKFDVHKAKIVNDACVKIVEVDEVTGSVILGLDIDLMKGEVIRWMVATGWPGYSRNACHNQIYRVEIAMMRARSVAANEETGDSSFLEYRKNLVAQALSTLLKKIGHHVDEGHFTCIPFSSQIQASTILVAGTPIMEIDDNENPGYSEETPETVLRADLGLIYGSNSSTVQDVLSTRLAEIKDISESRRSESLLLSSWVTSLDNLTRATLHYDLLCRPLEADIKLMSLSESGQMNNVALFIMYNYSRVLSILRKFTELAVNGEYPELPMLAEVDFSRLCEREEEVQLLQLLMEWPRVMESAVNFMRFQMNLDIVSKYLMTLAKAFNSFYFQIVVLVPTNASHNFSTMMARIYLLKAICNVFEDCLDILQVNHAKTALL